MNETIVLFDMDGTLTESREKFDSKELAESLLRLSELSDIGIITGSDEDYLREQMGDFLSQNSCRYRTYLLPCNGTKFFLPPMSAADDFQLSSNVSMEEHLGEKKYRNLICELVYSQVDACHIGLPMTGHFINCRGSTINWCPIGRNANFSQREKFIAMDKENDIRTRILQELRAMLKLKEIDHQITIKLGGDTSFDIYPTGWDKTYGLKHFPGRDVWFVGDRCQKDGNDYEIYQACSRNNRAFETNGPKQSVLIINEIIDRLKRATI